MSRAKGQRAEQAACEFLQGHGLRLLEKNYRCRRGEIDLIMGDGEEVVFVEVRYRRHSAYGGALASIDARKRAKLIATASHYLQSKGSHRPARFDVVAIDANQGVQWIRNAFDAV